MTSLTFPKDRFTLLAFLGLAVFFCFWPRLHVFPSSSVGGWKQQIVAEKPVDLGHLEPKGRTNPDGSEVWGYPEGSGLEEVIEVHVKDGRVVREVLRPSPRIAADAFRDS